MRHRSAIVLPDIGGTVNMLITTLEVAGTACRDALMLADLMERNDPVDALDLMADELADRHGIAIASIAHMGPDANEVAILFRNARTHLSIFGPLQYNIELATMEHFPGTIEEFFDMHFASMAMQQ